MSPEELSREQMEEQLMKGEFEEIAPESPETPETAEASVETPVPSFEELQQRLSALEEQLTQKEDEIRQKAGALSEERDRRRGIEGNYAQLMDYIQEARNRASEQSPTESTEDLGEYEEYLQAVEKRFGPAIRQMAERQSQLEQALSQQYQMQQQVQQFQSQSQEFLSKKPDYHEAMNFLITRVRARAGLFYPDQQQRETIVAQEAQRLVQFSPEQLYNLAVVDGYAPQQDQTAPPAAPKINNPPMQRPKSLATVPGATGLLPDSVEGKAAKVIDASFADLQKIPLEELDNILKSMSK